MTAQPKSLTNRTVSKWNDYSFKPLSFGVAGYKAKLRHTYLQMENTASLGSADVKWPKVHSMQMLVAPYVKEQHSFSGPVSQTRISVSQSTTNTAWC